MKKITAAALIALFSLLIVPKISFAIQEWYEGYKLEPYWSKSKSPLVKEFDESHILDLDKNILVARGESNIWTIGLRNKQTIENVAIESSVKELFEAVKKLRVSTDKRLEGVIAGNPELAKELKDRIKSTFKIMHCRIFTMKGVLRVTSSVKYSGPDSILGLVYPYLAPTIEASAPAAEEENKIGSDAADVSPEAAPMEIKGDYTGLIVDASGLKIEPAIDPWIFDQAGNPVFGPASTFDEVLLSKKGKIGYAKSLKEARSDPRVGKNPLIVKAISAKRNCDLLVDTRSGRQILEESAKTGFLDKLGVTIII